MCKTCWIDEGSPSELPENSEAIVDAIEALYLMDGCRAGGPLHVELDDLNLDMDGHVWVPWQADFSPEAMAKAQEICDLMNPLPVPQRYAVMAKHEGWLDQPKPSRGHFDHDPGCALDMDHHPTPCLPGAFYTAGPPLPMIAACRDVDPARLKAMLPDAEIPPVYPGSIMQQCRACNVPVWVGPKTQEIMEARPDVIVLCFPCGARTDPIGIVELGNTFKPKAP